MIHTILLIVLASILTHFVGYWVHRAFHQSWSGPFYDAHRNHHYTQYPSDDFTSDIYRGAGRSNTAYWFALAFVPFVLMIVASVVFFGVSLWSAGVVLASMIGTALLHDQLHDAYHLNKSNWQYIPFFSKWQDIHRTHHIDQTKNYGIFSFVLDKLFKTFQD